MNHLNFNFLYIDTYTFGKNWVFPESRVPYSLLRYICAGEGAFFIDNEEIIAKEGAIIYIPCHSKLSCHAISDNFTFTSIRFNTSVLFENVDILKEQFGLPYSMECKDEKQYFDEINYWIKTEHPARMFLVRGALSMLIGKLISRESSFSNDKMSDLVDSGVYSLQQIKVREERSRSRMDPRIQIVIDYILLHPNEKYTPDKMAKMAELSKQRFSSLFKEQIGKTPMSYVKEIKMTTAARKLLVSNKNISEISYEFGYEDPNYFIREFRQTFGYTPKQYRMSVQK